MIGVRASAADLEIASEFFELFKTPWEPAVSGRRYLAVLSTNGSADDLHADVCFEYSSKRGIAAAEATTPGTVHVQSDGLNFPLYGRMAVLGRSGPANVLRAGGRVVEEQTRAGSRRIYRIGYDLFSEIRYLLRRGQPPAQAATPTLDCHIAFLRSRLLEAGCPVIEVPPRPAGYRFVCCLTHDIDFFGLRRHRLDRTLAGFVVRSTAGTLWDLLRGRREFAGALRNWMAAASLPFVFLRLARDPWRPLEDYMAADSGKASTFFLVPFKGVAGRGPDGRISPGRAVAYQISDVASEARAAAVAGCELGVHGIDAWRDDVAGRRELRELSAVTGAASAGVRMHWLYFDDGSPQRLESAGYEYDSTCGYNDAVGYRAGTAQVFSPTGCGKLVELPMTIMDTALFYPTRMGVTREAADRACNRIITHAADAGGTVVVNWHCRSLAPERQWGGVYRELVARLEQAGAWFATARDSVDWFRWRRTIQFVRRTGSDDVTVVVPGLPRAELPGGILQLHGAAASAPGRTSERPLQGPESFEIDACSVA